MTPSRDTILVVCTVITVFLTTGILYYTYMEGHKAGKQHPECLQAGAELYQQQLYQQCLQTENKQITIQCIQDETTQRP